LPIADCDIADGFIASGKGCMSFDALVVHLCDVRSCDSFIAKTLFAPYVVSLNEIKL